FQGRYFAVIKYLPSRTLIEARSRPVLVYKKLTGMLVDIGVQAIAISGELFHVFHMLITGTAITVGINFRGFLKLHANKFVTNLVIGNTDRKSTRLNSSHVKISYAVFCLKQKTLNAATPL